MSRIFALLAIFLLLLPSGEVWGSTAFCANSCGCGCKAFVDFTPSHPDEAARLQKGCCCAARKTPAQESSGLPLPRRCETSQGQAPTSAIQDESPSSWVPTLIAQQANLRPQIPRPPPRSLNLLYCVYLC